jgi:SAM-dependent methyltransferase
MLSIPGLSDNSEDHGVLLDRPASYCPVCASPRLSRLGHAASPSRAGHDRYGIVECHACGLSFSDPQPSAEDVAAFYEAPTAYSDIYGSIDHPWQRLQHQFDLARVARTRAGRLGRLLDVGCSFGLLLEVAQQAGWDAYGVEPGLAAVETARRRVGQSRVYHGFVQDLPGDVGGFDCISMSHVFEHLVQFRPVLDRLAQLLNPGGILAVQSPNRRSLRSFQLGPDYRPIEHPFYWTYKAVFHELRRIGLQPAVAPPLWRSARGMGRQALKELALVVESGLATHLNIGLKSTLEVHGRKRVVGT